jgi:L-ribulose-5-phosphate 3-epimerase
VDLTVRPGGHVLPENVGRDLPRAVEAVRTAGVEVPMITTRLNGAGDPFAKEILTAASALGIRYFRIGNHKYSGETSPWEQLPGFIDDLRGLVALAERHAMIAGYHNHSGYGDVGGALWDLHHMILAIDSPHFGSNFDAGHTTVEGAYGTWETNTRLMAPYVKMMAVKDFVWDGDRPRWVPLGQGVVKLIKVLTLLRGEGFIGPISMHFEYAVDSDDHMLEETRAAALTLRDALHHAGYG